MKEYFTLGNIVTSEVTEIVADIRTYTANLPLQRQSNDKQKETKRTTDPHTYRLKLWTFELGSL